MMHNSLWPWSPGLCSCKVLIRKQDRLCRAHPPSRRAPSHDCKAILALPTLPGRGRQSRAPRQACHWGQNTSWE